MDLELDGRLALVTGSTAGIGNAIAGALAREGARVVVNGRSEASVEEAVAELEASTGGDVAGFAGDVSRAGVAEELAGRFPDVEILVNNVGVFEPTSFEEIPDEEWRRLFEANVLSGVRLARLYLPGMRRRDWGRILFISSESGVHIPVEMIHYGVTKAAQIAVARGLAEHVAGTGITVNSVLPGPTSSRGVRRMLETQAEESGRSVEEVSEAFFDTARPTSLIQRFADPDEVASLVAYLASPLASATTGAPVRVDGGVVRSAF